MSKKMIECPKCGGAGTVEESHNWFGLVFFTLGTLILMGLVLNAMWQNDAVAAMGWGASALIMGFMATIGWLVEFGDYEETP